MKPYLPWSRHYDSKAGPIPQILLVLDSLLTEGYETPSPK